jgi:hypothetical protein
MGGVKYLLLWGLLFAWILKVESSPFNFTEFEDAIYEIKIEVSESKKEFECRMMIPFDEECPGDLFHKIAKMKIISIQKCIKDSKRRWNYESGAFVLDTYYSFMEGELFTHFLFRNSLNDIIFIPCI